MYLNQSKGDNLWNTSLPLTFRYQNLYQNQSKGDNSWNTKVKSPCYDATLTKWHSSYQDRFKMNWDSITLTNLSPFRDAAPLIRPRFPCKRGGIITEELLLHHVSMKLIYLFNRFIRKNKNIETKDFTYHEEVFLLQCLKSRKIVRLPRLGKNNTHSFCQKPAFVVASNTF